MPHGATEAFIVAEAKGLQVQCPRLSRKPPEPVRARHAIVLGGHLWLEHNLGHVSRDCGLELSKSVLVPHGRDLDLHLSVKPTVELQVPVFEVKGRLDRMCCFA